MNGLQYILKRIYQNGGQVFAPQEMGSIQQVSIHFIKNGGCKVPNDYAQLLTMINGLSWNGVTLFSLTQKEGKEDIFPGVVEAFQKNSKNPVFKERLLLGFVAEGYLTYHANKKEYQILFTEGYELVKTYPSLYEFLKEITASITDAAIIKQLEEK